MTRALAVSLALGCAACAGLDARIAKLDEAYAADTIVANRLLEPMDLEPAHGQLTFALTTRFAEKLLRASLQPNLLQLTVAAGGRAWKQEVTRFGVTFDNGLWLDGGTIAMALGADGLELAGEQLVLRARVDGKGQLAARLKLYGVPVTRNVEVWSRYQDALHLQLEHAGSVWLLRAVGEPMKIHVEVQLPAVTLAGHEFFATTFARDVEFPVEKLKPFPLPMPAPRRVKVGAGEVELALTDLAMGAHGDRLWFGANLVASLPVAAPNEPPVSP